MSDPFTAMLITDAIMIGLDIALTPPIKGPRLDSTKTTTSQYGTPIPRFWGKRKFECSIIHAEDLRESVQHSKTKGAKTTEYKYYATFAALICDHEIDAVTRIWMDDKLVYQTTGVGPTSVAAMIFGQNNSPLTVGGNMRIYLGTEDQNADPRYVSWCEDRYGPNSAPAYRGSAYVFFEELPVNNFGNRIPNITIEAVSSKTTAHPYESLTTGLADTDSRFVFSGNWMAYWSHSGTPIEWYDVASRTKVGSSPAAGTMVSLMPSLAVTPDGVAHFAGPCLPSGDVFLFRCEPLGVPDPVATTAASNILECTRAFPAPSTRVFTAYDTHSGYMQDGDHVSDSDSGREWCVDGDGAIWMASQPTGASSNFTLTNLDGTESVTLTGTSRSGPTTMRMCFVAEYNHFFVYTDGHFYTVDRDSLTVTNSGSLGFTPTLFQQETGRLTVWSGLNEYSLQDGSLIRSLNQNDWVNPSSYSVTGYDIVNNAVWGRTGSTLRILYLDRIGSNGVTLGTVVDTVSEWCGLTGQDTSALTQTVLGYSVTQGTGKDMIGPLLDIHDVDCRPHDFSVQFVNRGGSPSGTLLTEDFVRGDSRYTVTIQQDTDLPRKLTFNFADVDHEQQPNNAIAQRPLDAVDTTREETIDLSTYADTVDSAQQKADRYLRRLWNSREQPKLSLTAQNLALEPGDVKTLSLDGALRNARLDKLTITPTQLDCEWIRDETSFAATNAATTGSTMDNSDEQTIPIPALTKGFVIDAPLVRDADNDVNPIIYFAAGSYGGTWPGATVNRGDDGTYDTLYASFSSTAGATWGVATAALATADPNVWDRGNTLSVSVFGTLTSHTEAEIGADDSLNLIALGDDGRWEFIQFATATLTGTDGAANVYSLTNLMRGRRGTEGNVGNHQANDLMVLLDKAVPVELGTDEVGNDMSFKIQTVARDVDAAPAIDLTYDGDTLKPYAPARIKWTTDGTDLTGTITRRTRVGGTILNGTTIPLSENSEAYEVDVYHGATFKRTISVSGTNVFTYTAAMMSADGNSVGSPPPVNVYQISDAVGRGFALAA